VGVDEEEGITFMISAYSIFEPATSERTVHFMEASCRLRVFIQQYD
jgi:hypothetical protein